MRGSIRVFGRWDYPANSIKGKYSKKYFYWHLECKDEFTNEKITCAPSYKELSKVLEEIIAHEIKYYTRTLGLVEARKRYRQLCDAMLKSIGKEEKRLDNKK
jgi:hypothetical protein